MFLIKLFLLILLIKLNQIESQNILNDINPSRKQANGGNNVPFFGACDRIAMRGVMNCLENFLPNRIWLDDNSGGVCWYVCIKDLFHYLIIIFVSNFIQLYFIGSAYSKYKSCISGLYDGLRVSMERERCPKSYSTRIIMDFSQNVIGFPLRVLCDEDDSKTQCPPKKIPKSVENI